MVYYCKARITLYQIKWFYEYVLQGTVFICHIYVRLEHHTS